MSYFSHLAIDYDRQYRDHSFTPPEMQLLWRLEDLQDRLQELTERKTGRFDDGACFSDAELRYVLPRDFLSVDDVEAAIELAIGDLQDRYGIRVREEIPEEDPIIDEVTTMQITFVDLLSGTRPLCAA